MELREIDGVKFEIDEEIKNLLPQQSPEAYEGLRQAIIASEFIDPLVVLVINGDNAVLGDGHTRLSIAEGEGLVDKLTIRRVDVADRAAAIEWVVGNQLSRRNLTDEQTAYYRGKLFRAQKKSPGNPQLVQNALIEKTPGNVAKSLAEQFGVSADTIKRDAKFAEAVDKIGLADPEEKDAILKGGSNLTRQQVLDKANSKTKKQSQPRVGGEIDQFGAPIPNALRDALADPSLAEALTLLDGTSESLRKSRIMDCIRERAKYFPMIKADNAVDFINTAMRAIEMVARHLRAARPQAVCPKCGGSKCPACSHTGLCQVMPCKFCSMACSACHGRGCNKCDGISGKGCDQCNGHGLVYARDCWNCNDFTAPSNVDLSCECGGRGVVPIHDLDGDDHDSPSDSE